MKEPKFLTWAQLHERGILPSRQHTRRLIAKGIIPKPARLGDPERGRLHWLEADIEAYIARKLAERDTPRPCHIDRADGNNVALRRRPHVSPSGGITSEPAGASSAVEDPQEQVLPVPIILRMPNA